MKYRNSSPQGKMMEIEPAPLGLESAYAVLLTEGARKFVMELVQQFDPDVEKMMRDRKIRKLSLDASNSLPDFLPVQAEREWRVWPVPERLRCRHVDLGDVSPADDAHFISALRSSAQGIQTDFDDGHCPSWGNQLHGLFNVYKAVYNMIPGVPPIAQAPVLMLRPRAWNMWEANVTVNGHYVPGPLFDFGLLMYHCGRRLVEAGSGPFFYLSKLEGAKEAALWNRVFVWTQEKLGFPLGTIKACVLIENVLASFEAEQILYELRHHSAGLNCGIWDYAASFVNKFGTRQEFVLPDRSKYVSMERHFLHSYMQLIVQLCHRHGAHATGGMAAAVLPPASGTRETEQKRREVTETVSRAKLREIETGVDGFMVYDVDLLPPMQTLFSTHTTGPNQILTSTRPAHVQVTAQDLLQMPAGGVTLPGLEHNIAVAILFIEAWLSGRGHYVYKGSVEDSATAEISRSQVWQWFRHGASLEGSNQPITRHLISSLVANFLSVSMATTQFGTDAARRRLSVAAEIFEQVVFKQDFPEFITTYLYDELAFVTENRNRKFLEKQPLAKL